ncbi:hypothetical protein XELAEV_18012066mg [Xenopus laevis]|uniref:Uncharacterized protein n=1 Tax=Xenopus laevis TaxID=8355 RepID=A0A974DNE0_XENLA|nr:hypothetical protein XELAEV_18012066mg [Xenopus laevis]
MVTSCSEKCIPRGLVGLVKKNTYLQRQSGDYGVMEWWQYDKHFLWMASKATILWDHKDISLRLRLMGFQRGQHFPGSPGELVFTTGSRQNICFRYNEGQCKLQDKWRI